jgi:cell division protein FtsB
VELVPRLHLVVERILPVTILVVAAVGAPALMFSSEGLPRLRSLEAEIAQVRAENAELARVNAQLHLKVRHLKQDPQAAERLARDELGLVRNTEVVFQFPAQR